MRRRATVATCLGVLILGGAGCTDPADPVGCLDAGRLEGRVVTGVRPVEANIMVREAREQESGRAEYRVETDEQGWYGVDLPRGRYVLRVDPSDSHWRHYDYGHDGPVLRGEDPDTLVIGSENTPHAADFALGALAISAAMPRHLEGERATIRLFHRREIEEWEYTRDHLTKNSEIHDGRVELLLDGLATGDYRVRLEVLGSQVWLPGTVDAEDVAWHRVAADSVAEAVMDRTFQPVRIEGRVTGAWLEMGLNRPSLTAVTADSSRILSEILPSEDGGFAFDFLVPEPVKIRVQQSWNGFGQWIGGPDFAQATVFRPAPGETITGIELNQCGLRLDVAWTKDLSFGSVIRLYEAGDPGPLAEAVFAPVDGQPLGFANIWPGDYLVRFTPGWGNRGQIPWVDQWFDQASDATGARIVTIGDWGEVVRLDVQLMTGGVAAGSLAVTDPGVVSRRVVMTAGDDPGLWAQRSLFDGATEFAFVGLPDGEYRIGVLPRGTYWYQEDPAPDGTVWWPGTTDWAGAGVVTITDAATVEGLVIPLD